jgi:hypothetical protein
MFSVWILLLGWNPDPVRYDKKNSGSVTFAEITVFHAVILQFHLLALGNFNKLTFFLSFPFLDLRVLAFYDFFFSLLGIDLIFAGPGPFCPLFVSCVSSPVWRRSFSQLSKKSFILFFPFIIFHLLIF